MTVTRKADVDPNLQLQVQHLARTMLEFFEQRKNSQAVKWIMPVETGESGDWNGDLFDLAGIERRFNRDKASGDFKKALQDFDDSGVVTDIEICQLAAEYLACMERAFRRRHTTRVRQVAHAMARYQGHGSPTGVFQQSVLGWMQELLKKASNV